MEVGEPERLWIERYARATGLAGVEARLVRRQDLDGFDRQTRYAPYLFVVGVWLVSTVGFGAVQYLRVGIFPLPPPGMFVLLPGWLLAVYVIRGLRARYEDLYDEIRDLPRQPTVAGTDADRRPAARVVAGVERAVRRFTVADGRDDPFAELFPGRLRWVVLGGGLLCHAAWFALDPSPMSTFTAIYGSTLATVYFFLIVPGVFYVLGAELVSLYVAVHLLLPVKLTADERIDFTDEHLYGGLRPVGRLLRDSSASFVVLMFAFGLFEWIAVGTGPFDPFSGLLTLTGLTFGIVIFAAPVYWLHVFMRTRKERMIKRIKRDIEAAGPDHDRAAFPETDPATPDDLRTYTHEYIRLNRVEDMHEFPVDFALVLEFAFVLLLPYLAHVSSIFVFEHLLHG